MFSYSDHTNSQLTPTHHTKYSATALEIFPSFCKKLWDNLSSISHLQPSDLSELASLLSTIKNETVGNIITILFTEIHLSTSIKKAGKSPHPDNQAYRRFYAYLNALQLSIDQMQHIEKKIIGVQVNLLGQALLMHDIRKTAPSIFNNLKKKLLKDGALINFTGLEVAIKGQYSGYDIRQGNITSHIARPEVLDVLQNLGINLIGAANNHISDFGMGGILAAIEEMNKRSLVFSGIGFDATDAMRHAIFIDPKTHLKIALLAVASGALKSAEHAGVIADNGPGLNAMHQMPDKQFNPQQVESNLKAIQEASHQADLVIFYHHNHCCNKNRNRSLSIQEIPKTWKAFAHKVIDAGAHVYISHGSPVVQAHEIYRNRPIFYGEGNLFFQTRKPKAYPKEAWQAHIRKVKFLWINNTMRFINFNTTELQLNHDAEKLETSGLPTIIR